MPPLLSPVSISKPNHGYHNVASGSLLASTAALSGVDGRAGGGVEPTP